MKKILLLVLPSVAAAFVQNMYAGSAVAWDHHGNIFYTYGEAQKKAEEHVLELSRRHQAVDAKLIGSTDVVGYGAIAVARRGSGSVIGVSLGRPSPADAENRAIEKCLRAGGSNPKVRWGFKG